MLKNTVIGALRSVTVIRHGTWLHSESTGREGIRRHSKGTEQLQKQCFSVEKLKMNSKEGRLYPRKIKGEIACVADQRLNMSFGIR